MQLTPYALLSALSLIFRGLPANAAVTPTSGSLSCERVTLGSESNTKWTVSCVPTNTAGASVASFDPALVNTFYVNSEAYVAATASYDLNLSSTFSKVDELTSSTVTTFSLEAVSGYTPDVPVSISSTAFAELSVLQTLNLQGIPLADSDLHLVLPASIKQISIIDCGLSNLSFEFTDGSAIADSLLTSIDLQQNTLNRVPISLYSLPSDISTVDLRGNDLMDLSTETITHTRQLRAWIDAEILQIDNATLATLDSSSQEERSSVIAQAADNANGSTYTSTQSQSSSGNKENITVSKGSGGMDVISITIIAVVVPAVLAVGITLAFVVHKRRQMQDQESDGTLDLPHPFDRHSYDKDHRDRLETSGQFTAVESELSRSRMSSNQEADDGVVVTPNNAFGQSGQQHSASTSANIGYVNLESPQDTHRSFSKTITRQRMSSHEDGDREHSLELLSTHSTSSTTPVQTRLGARKALQEALETLLKSKSDEDNSGSFTPALLTVKRRQYFFSQDTKIDETPLAFFIDCRLVPSSASEDVASEPVASTRLVLKFFIEDDADLAGRESYALSCLQHDESTRAFVPRLFDEALEYELESETASNTSADAVKLSCCVLVLETPSRTTLREQMVESREPVAHEIPRVVTALRALHSRGLVHGALHNGSLVVCSPDAHLTFWGLEYASRAGHKVPCPDLQLLDVCRAECFAPEVASVALNNKPSPRASPSLDIWSLGVMILKVFASSNKLEEFQNCAKPEDVLHRLDASELDDELSKTCFFEKSIAAFVLNDDMKDLLHQCLERNPLSRPSVDSILKHKAFRVNEREVSRRTRVKSGKIPRMLSAIVEEKDPLISGEPEREASGKDQHRAKPQEEKLETACKSEDAAPEPLPPSLWLFLPPPELELDLIQRASFYSIDQWVSKLTYFQQQKAEELRFPLVFMCEACDSNAAIPCSIATTTKFGCSVPASLLPLVMSLVRETMLFLEARAILSSGLSVGEASGLAGPQQWEELRTFYRALEHMELATVNPVNEVMFTPMEQQLKSRDPSKAQQVLNELKGVVFSEEKREYVRNLLNALVSDEKLEAQVERISWAALRRCDVMDENSMTPSPTRWLCSHHAP